MCSISNKIITLRLIYYMEGTECLYALLIKAIHTQKYITATLIVREDDLKEGSDIEINQRIFAVTQ